jgi:hypothetical protein
LVSIGLVVSEEKIFEKDYDVRRTPSDGKSSPGLWPGELKKKFFVTHRKTPFTVILRTKFEGLCIFFSCNVTLTLANSCPYYNVIKNL